MSGSWAETFIEKERDKRKFKANKDMKRLFRQRLEKTFKK
jgi:hypothetical protein